MQKRQLFTTLLLLSLPSAALQAASINLFNTGVDAGHVKITTGGTSDPHWTITPGSLTTGGPAAVVVSNQMVGIYIQDPGSAWIQADASGSANGTHTISQEFDLTGFDHTTALINGSFATDNTAEIYLNGTNIGIGTGELSWTLNSSGGFTRWHDFTLNNGFQSGINRIDVVYGNLGGQGALNVLLNGTASAVPEPTGTALGMVALGALLRRRRR